jgi:hypothetical protein
MVGHDNALAMTLREANVLATNDDTITGHKEIGRMERETGLEPATFSLEGLSVHALWHRSWDAEHRG